MSPVVNLVMALVVAFWVSAIALLSVQNASPVSLRFLNLQSIDLPVGLVIAFSAAAGMVGAAAVLPLWRSDRPRPRKRDRLGDRSENDHEFEEL
jgi:uncharacterized integral membrane protein